MTDDAPSHDAVMNPIIIETTGARIGINILNGGINLALISVAVLTLLSWGILALHHADDRYNVGWSEGTRIALTLAADQGRTVGQVLDRAEERRAERRRASLRQGLRPGWQTSDTGTARQTGSPRP